VTVLRAARRDEAALIAGIQERSATVAYAHIFPPERYPFPRGGVLARCAAALQDPAAQTIVAEIDREPVGFACVRPEWLETLYVVPERWGAGVAPALHDWALEVVRELGSERCSLWVLEDNARARRFYERRGWCEDGRTRVVSFPPHPLEIGYTVDF
jgi:GNAT superfamily N-acetyltransferase